MKLANSAFMNRAGSRFYEALTDHPLWADEIAAMRRHAEPLPERPRVLDLGCGPGVSTLALASQLPAGSEIIGVDLSPHMIERARVRLARPTARGAPPPVRVTFQEANAMALPFGDGHFDAVFGHSLLYLVPDAASVVAEVARVLTPGGAMVFMEPDRSGHLAQAALSGLARAHRWRQRPLSAARLGASMVLWRAFSAQAGQLDASTFEGWMSAARFVDVQITPAFAGLGFHVSGRQAS